MPPVRKVPRDTEVAMTGEQISARTYYRRRIGAKPMKKKALERRKLTENEEKALVNGLLAVYQNDFRPTNSFLNTVAHKLYCSRVGKLYRKFGPNWTWHFKNRHPELYEICKIPRIRDKDPEVIAANENTVLSMANTELQLDLTRPLAENVYLITVIGVFLRSPTDIDILHDEASILKQSKVDRAVPMITVVECTNGTGNTLPTTILWPHRTQMQSMNAEPGTNWIHWNSDSGRFDKRHRQKWFREVFEPLTSEAAGERTRYLVVKDALKFGDIGDFLHKRKVELVNGWSSVAHTSFDQPTVISNGLQVAFRESVENAYKSGHRKLGRKHFNALYHYARTKTMAVYLAGSIDPSCATSAAAGVLDVTPSLTKSATLGSDETFQQLHLQYEQIPWPHELDKEISSSSIIQSIEDDPGYKYLANVTKLRIQRMADLARMSLRETCAAETLLPIGE